jgi:hypothetical protein
MTVTEATYAPPLTNADRCDRCGARARVRVTLMNGQLFFCAHHGRKYMPKLRQAAIEVYEDPEYATTAGAKD